MNGVSSSTNRIPGLATGMDTDQVVKDMLIGEQNKIDKIKQQQQTTKWKQEEYREIIKDAKSLYAKYFDPLSKDYILSTKSFSTTSITSSNNSVVTATGGAGSIASNYTFEVDAKATSAQMSSNISISKGATLGSLGFSGESSFKIGLGNGKSSATITISENDTIESLATKINEASNGQVKATFSEMTGKFTLTASETGVNSKLSIISGDIDVDGKFVENGKSDTLSFLGINGSEVAGSNGVVRIKDENGALLKDLSIENNSFTIDGVTYDIKGVGTADLKTSTDTSGTIDKMKDFIKDYNDLIGKIHSNLTEKKNPDFKPLTDAQKKEMSKEEIEQWEEKAKEGILRGDRELRNMLDNLNATFSGELAQFGITLSRDYTKPGQLVLDEDKFAKALELNGDAVFKGVTTTLEKTSQIFKDNVGSSSSILVKKAGLENTASFSDNLFSDEIKRQEDKIKELNKKLKTKEDSLYKKFARLEAVMSQLNTQMSYLLQ